MQSQGPPPPRPPTVHCGHAHFAFLPSPDSGWRVTLFNGRRLTLDNALAVAELESTLGSSRSRQSFKLKD